MRQFFAYERRLQDLESRLNNVIRYGEVTDVKFDEEKRRWYVKTSDGEGDTTTFKSDWLPWSSFGHGSIKVSLPPKKGMKVRTVSPNGEPEMGSVEAFHNSKDAKSPHDKPDEFVMTVEGEDGSESVKIHHAKDHTTVTLGDTVWKLTKDGASLKSKSISMEADNFEVKAKAVKFTKG